MKLREIIRFFKKYVKNEKKIFIKSFLFVFISSILGVGYGYIIGRATDYVVMGSFLIAILLLLLYLFIAVIDNLIFDRLGKIGIKKACSNMMEKIGFDVYYKVGLFPARAFEEKTSGELINRVVSDASTITDTIRQLINVSTTLFTSLLIFIYILFNSWIIALEILLYFFLFYFFSKSYLPKIKESQKEITKEKDKTVALVNETIRGVREIRALGIRDKINDIVKKTINGTFIKTKKQMVDEENYYSATYTLGNLLEIVVFLTCIILIALEKSSVGFFVSMTYYIYRFSFLVEWIMNMSSSYQKMKVSVERVSEILNNKLYSDVTFGDLNKIDIKGNIEFKNVSFRYSDKEEYVLKDFNITFSSNKKIAIVGKSGQGKTTIFNLLLRYFTPNNGAILIDNYPIENFSEEAFHKNIAIIRQEPFIFNKTILENFYIMDPYISLNKIRKICKIAEIDDYIMSLPNQYDTKIGEGGVNLSGGQKQRLAIARALLKNSKIILFDEATSALDNENQNKIKKVIDNLVEDHTIIIVAHRLSTIIDADVIYLIDDGKIIASGTHKELMNKSAIYKKLYDNENCG